MAAIATGGFSTKNASVGFYDSVSIEMILSLFMYLGALSDDVLHRADPAAPIFTPLLLPYFVQLRIAKVKVYLR